MADDSNGKRRRLMKELERGQLTMLTCSGRQDNGRRCESRIVVAVRRYSQGGPFYCRKCSRLALAFDCDLQNLKELIDVNCYVIEPEVRKGS
jgi:hypothetical protein